MISHHNTSYIHNSYGMYNKCIISLYCTSSFNQASAQILFSSNPLEPTPPRKPRPLSISNFIMKKKKGVGSQIATEEMVDQVPSPEEAPPEALQEAMIDLRPRNICSSYINPPPPPPSSPLINPEKVCNILSFY